LQGSTLGAGPVFRGWAAGLPSEEEEIMRQKTTAPQERSTTLILNERIGGERRSDRRYNIALRVRWDLLRRKRLLDSGTGRTVNLSSGGILLETGGYLPVGLSVSLAISWPVLLHNTTLMQLIVDGRVVRSDGGRVAIRTVQHEFRTVGVPLDQHAGKRAPAVAPFPVSPAAAPRRPTRVAVMRAGG
jgi:hypothetical protein